MVAIAESIHPSEAALPVCLWKENPYRLVSLWDMLQFSAGNLIRTLHHLCGLQSSVKYMPNLMLNSRMADNSRNDLLISLDIIYKECVSMGLTASAASASQLRESIEKNQHAPTVAGISRHLQGRLEDELKAALFFHLTPDRARMYNVDEAFGPEVSDAFPSASYDLREAGNCYALSRYTACVFHLMRVLECGLQAVSRATDITDPRPNWDPVVKRLDKLLKMDTDHLKKNPTDRVAEVHDNRDFYAGVSSHFHAIKLAWRNRVMHIERSYSEEDAKEIMNASKGLMRQLATRLHE